MIWTTERMLLWGMTYPELSKSYTETVCTGAVLVDRPGLIRLYPLNLRYLPAEQRPSKWSIVTAEVAESPRDRRPESRRVRSTSIRLDGHVGTDDYWRERKRILLREEHMVDGLEDMQGRQAATGQSLGIIRRVEIIEAFLERTPRSDLAEHRRKYEAIVNQTELWPTGSKPVPAPLWKPRITFKAEGDREPYTRAVLDWEVVEAAKRHADMDNPSAAFSEWITGDGGPLGPKGDPYLILGNISSSPSTFVVVCIMYPRRKVQLSLL